MTRREGPILVIGPGPVVVGEGSYPQFLAARACRLLRRAGFRVLVIENDPAGLMDLDGEPDDLYVEPLNASVLKGIIEERGIDTVWYGPGGRRSVLLGLELQEEGWHKGLSLKTPDLGYAAVGGDRLALLAALRQLGINSCTRVVSSLQEGQDVARELTPPLLVRPDFSRAGWGAGLAYNLEEYPALLSDALRESPTGRIVIEKPHTDGRKYIVMLLRDEQGNYGTPAIVEQLELLPAHDGNSIMACPPSSLSEEYAETLGNLAGRLAEALDLVGLCEFKLCIASAGHNIAFLDLNYGPSRHTPILEALTGVDLVRVHLDLVLGESLPTRYLELEENRTSSFILIVPELLDSSDRDEGYLSLASRAVARRTFMGANAREASTLAVESLNARGRGCNALQLEILENLVRAGEPKRRMGRLFKKTPIPEIRQAACLSRKGDGGGPGVALIGPESVDYELEASCSHALQAAMENGCNVLLYTPDIDFALFARNEAGGVFLGPLQADAIDKWARSNCANEIVLHFAGGAGLTLAPQIHAAGLEVSGWGGAKPNGNQGIHNLLREAGIPLLDSVESRGLEDGLAILEGVSYPIIAVYEEHHAQNEVLLHSQEDAERFVRELPEDRVVIWRELPEEVQEIQVEAVAGAQPEDIVLLWEQLDEAAISCSDGLGVYPPFYLTSEQKGRADSLARSAIRALPFKGNLSMKILMRNGDSWIEKVSIGASPNLLFLERASGLPLAAAGISVLLGLQGKEWAQTNRCNVVRMPVIPYGLIADSDLLPSPQRRSSGSVIGFASNPAAALAKVLWSEGIRPQTGRTAFLSVANREKRRVILLARELAQAGYCLMATRGTARALALAGLKVDTVNKLKEGRPNILDHIRNGEVGLIVNIPRGKYPHSDGFYIRAAAARHGIPCITNIEFALAVTSGLRHAEPLNWEIMQLSRYAGLKHEVMEG